MLLDTRILLFRVCNLGRDCSNLGESGGTRYRPADDPCGYGRLDRWWSAAESLCGVLRFSARRMDSTLCFGHWESCWQNGRALG